MDENEIKEKIEIAKKIAESAGETYKEKAFEIILTYLINPIQKDVLEKKEPKQDNLIITGEEIPNINAKACSPAILELLATPWGRKIPRTASEIKEALRLNAKFYPESTVPATLTQLTRAGKVRRLIKDGALSYVIRD